MSDRTKRSSDNDDSSYTSTTTDLDDDSRTITSLECYPVTTIKIDSLVFEDSPRRAGEDPEHTRLLAEADGVLPPITVHRPTMRVIDGLHRVQAALLNGKSLIEARLLDCDEGTAFVLAVEANITHGLPLSRLDRKAAAARIIDFHPQWSDRAVAASTGLSDKTVSVIRACSTAESPQSNTRRGRDGRLRPLNSAAKRRQAAAMINDNPEAGLREIARATGLSPATVLDVRQRTDRSEDPVPQKYQPVENHLNSSTAGRRARKPGSSKMPVDFGAGRHTLLAKLRNDPSLKFNEAGRRTLRWLHRYAVDPEDWEGLGIRVPDHCVTLVASLARRSAMTWTALAEALEQQFHDDASSG